MSNEPATSRQAVWRFIALDWRPYGDPVARQLPSTPPAHGEGHGVIADAALRSGAEELGEMADQSSPSLPRQSCPVN
jgi:hypothetical protein